MPPYLKKTAENSLGLPSLERVSSDSGEDILRANGEASSADGGIQRADIGDTDVAWLLTGVDRGYGSPLVIG